MAELKPCPFCGGDARLQTKKRYKDKRAFPEYRVIDTNTECCVFPVTRWCKTETEAVKAWERRNGGKENAVD